MKDKRIRGYRSKIDIFDDSFLHFDFAVPSVKDLRNEFELKRLLINEFRKLKDDRPGSTNTITIDHAISVVESI